VDQLALNSGVPSGERRAARMWLQAARLGLPQCWWMGCMRERTETATFSITSAGLEVQGCTERHSQMKPRDKLAERRRVNACDD